MTSAPDLIHRYHQGQRDFNGLCLTAADLTQANLKGIDLSYADLNQTDLSRANLRGADLSYASLSGVNLTGADLRGCSLIGTDLRDTHLQEANLTAADYAPGLTRFPPDFQPEQAHMQRIQVDQFPPSKPMDPRDTIPPGN